MKPGLFGLASIRSFACLVCTLVLWMGHSTTLAFLTVLAEGNHFKGNIVSLTATRSDMTFTLTAPHRNLGVFKVQVSLDSA